MAILTPKKAAAALAKRKKARGKFPPFEIDKFLFKEQLDFVTSPAKYVSACCSVRSGKTTACAADLIHTALTHPGTTSLYITLARTSAKTIAWPELKKINRDFGLGAKINESDLTMHFSNDSWIRLYGGNEESEIEKIRGLSNVALVYLDESQAFRSHIKELVEDIVAKRLYDTDGRCRLIGTPGPVEGGYFFDCCKSPTWTHFHWTMLQNPWLLKKSGRTPQQLIDADCARKGVTHDDPSIQRECYGIWKRDPNALLLTYDRTINDYQSLPPGKHTYILGIDLGQRDYNFLSILAFSETSPITYLVEEKFASNQLTDDLAKDIKALMLKYPMAKLVVDAGGQGLAIVEDMKARHGLPLEAADKKGKLSNYAFLNNALRTGTFKAKHTTMFAQDCNILQRDDNRSTPDKTIVKGHSDAVDACLYAFKFSPAYAHQAPANQPKPGTKEYEDQQAQILYDHHVNRLQKERELKDGQGLNWELDANGVPPWLKYSE